MRFPLIFTLGIILGVAGAYLVSLNALVYILITVLVLLIVYLVFIYIEVVNSESGFLKVRAIYAYDTEIPNIKHVRIESSSDAYSIQADSQTVEKIKEASEIEIHLFYTKIAGIKFNRSFKDKLSIIIFTARMQIYGLLH